MTYKKWKDLGKPIEPLIEALVTDPEFARELFMRVGIITNFTHAIMYTIAESFIQSGWPKVLAAVNEALAAHVTSAHIEKFAEFGRVLESLNRETVETLACSELFQELAAAQTRKTAQSNGLILTDAEVAQSVEITNAYLLAENEVQKNAIIASPSVSERLRGLLRLNILSILVSVILSMLIMAGHTAVVIQWKSRLALEYVTRTRGKAHVAVITKAKGVRVFSEPDCESLSVHCLMHGEYVALDWHRTSDMRAVIYEFNPVTGEPIKIGWIPHGSYARIKTPVKQLFSGLYFEQE